MDRVRGRARRPRLWTLAVVGTATCLTATAHSQTAFDKAMQQMGELYFVESHCSDKLVVVITNPSLEGFYRDAVRVRPGAFRDAVRASEKALDDSDALAATCSKIFDRFNGPEIFVNNKN